MTAVLVALSGCSDAPQPTPSSSEAPLDSFLGGTFEDVTREIPPDIFVIIQDASVLAGADPTYTAVAYGSPDWTVLALCADQPDLRDAASVEVAVLPSAVASRGMIADARAGEYRETVTCEDRPYGASSSPPH